MLSHKFRFHGHGSLRYAFRHGQSARGRLIQVRVSHNIRRLHPRVAVIVSKKVSKKAVVRNAIRRRLYEAARARFDELPPSSDIIITVFTSEVLDISFDELCQSLLQLTRDATARS